MVRIVHLTQSVERGGAAIAANRIHEAVTDCGVDSKIFVEIETQNAAARNPMTQFNRLCRRVSKFLSKRLSKLLLGNMAVYFSTGLIPSPWFKYLEQEKPDIVHLHFLGNEILSIKQISRISCPVVITVHDYWVLGSGFHLDYLEECSAKKKNSILCLLMRHIEKSKINSWQSKNITLVAPSTFVENLLAQHNLLSRFSIHKIHHPLNQSLFKVQSKTQSRTALGLDPQLKYILFPAGYGYEDPNKGFHILEDVLRNIRLKCDYDFELLLFGQNPGKFPKDFPCNIHFLGYVRDKHYLNHIYSASDVLVLPSRFETYGLVVQEAIQCGLPSVVTAGLGMDDIITHGENGFLVNYGDVDKFGSAVVSAFHLNVRTPDETLSAFDSKNVGKNYKKVYQNILHRTC